MIDVFGTLGPGCDDEQVLFEMFREGMTGIRINLSHVGLSECSDTIKRVQNAADRCGVCPKILIDMQGPELRIGELDEPVNLCEGDVFCFGEGGVLVDPEIMRHLEEGWEVLLDDGRIMARVDSKSDTGINLRVIRGGVLRSRKSLAVVGHSIDLPAITESDRKNIMLASRFGITGVMQPFVRSVDDLRAVRAELADAGGKNIKVYAKIENMTGVENLVSFFSYADEIVIARGDLGNAMPLWELPAVQKSISCICKKHGMPFMVVTQMLASMEHNRVPTRAEVNDVYNAVLDGAASVMVTAETAVGDNPVDVIRYLRRTAETACTS